MESISYLGTVTPSSVAGLTIVGRHGGSAGWSAGHNPRIKAIPEEWPARSEAMLSSVTLPRSRRCQLSEPQPTSLSCVYQGEVPAECPSKHWFL